MSESDNNYTFFYLPSGKNLELSFQLYVNFLVSVLITLAKKFYISAEEKPSGVGLIKKNIRFFII